MKDIEIKNKTKKNKLIFNEDKYFANEKTGKLIILRAGRELRGKINDYYELSEDEYNQLIAKREGYEEKETTSIQFYEEIESNWSEREIKHKAMNFSLDGIPSYEEVNDMLRPIAERTQSETKNFLENKEEITNTVSNELGGVLRRFYAEAKKIVPSKLTMKIESHKKISKMFNLDKKRNEKLKLSKENISELRNIILKENVFIHGRIEDMKEKIRVYGENIIELGGVRDKIDDIINARAIYISVIYEKGDLDPAQQKFTADFIRDTESIIASKMDIEAWISSIEQRRNLIEKHKDAAGQAVRQLNNLENIMMPSLIQEYEAYNISKDLTSTHDVINIAKNGMKESMDKNTAMMGSAIRKSIELHNSPVHSIESLLKRQNEIIQLTKDIDQGIEASRKNIIDYKENITLINNAAVALRENSGKANIQSHLEYIEQLKKS